MLSIRGEGRVLLTLHRDCMCTCDTGVDEDDGSEQLASLAGVVCQILHPHSHLSCHRDSFLRDQHRTKRLGD